MAQSIAADDDAVLPGIGLAAGLEAAGVLVEAQALRISAVPMMAISLIRADYRLGGWICYNDTPTKWAQLSGALPVAAVHSQQQSGRSPWGLAGGAARSHHDNRHSRID
ncbi:hypothetical protein [Mycobacterium simiae]|uniref:hypothetical protein n=1 Tax=Mycobacterium simiae TaxID=1784 RepID=UPI0021CDE408|nr:hypothetical protein [Mycobacterium simiae]